jgi:hypothetical protein
VRGLAFLATLAALAALAAACGSGGATSDAASDTGGGADVAPDGGAQLCDPAAQNCASGSKCDFGCDGTTATVACRPDIGSGAIGAACSTTTMQCAKGTACITMPGGGPLCRKYCAGDGDCATGERCHNDNVGVACGAPATTFLLHFCY